MDPHQRFCHNERCWAYGRAREGHIVIHSKKERRYRCKRCGQTFSATKGTALSRVHKPHELVAPKRAAVPAGSRAHRAGRRGAFGTRSGR